MSVTYTYPTICGDDLSYHRSCCLKLLKGGVGEIALVRKSYQPVLKAALDASNGNATADAAAWQAAKNAGKVIVIDQLKGTYDGSKATKGAGYGRKTSQVTGRKHLVEVADTRVPNNGSFANNLQFDSNWVLWFAIDEFIFSSNATVSYDFGMPIGEALDSVVELKHMFEWENVDLPELYLKPDWLFLCEPYLDVYFINRVALNLTFAANFLTPCAGGGTLTLVSVFQGITDVSADYSLTPVVVAAAAVSAAPVVVATAYTPGTYTFTFQLTGCGQGGPVTKSVEVTI